MRVVGGPDQGKGLEVTRPIVVGGGEGVDLRLTDTAVSGQHVQLEPRPDGVFVKDLGSTNGTLIGGARIESAIVESQAVIAIGRTMLSLTMSDEREEAIDGPTELEGLVGGSSVMRRLFGLIEKLAPSETPVLLLGETGTGKTGSRAPFISARRGARLHSWSSIVEPHRSTARRERAVATRAERSVEPSPTGPARSWRPRGAGRAVPR